MNLVPTTPSRRLSSAVRRALRSPLAQRLSFPHGVDAYLQAINPQWSVEQVRASLVSRRCQTADTVTVQLRPNGAWQGFAAGQFVSLSVEIDGVRRTRCFSPANSVHTPDGLLELTCKVGPDSVVSRYLRDDAPIGLSLDLSQADGQFALPAKRPERIVLISGGSGITPVLSMLRTLCDEGHAGRVTFLHYCNTASDQLYAEELQGMASMFDNIELLRCYAEPGQGGELSGRFSAAQLSAAVPDFDQAQTFLCGPPGMMEAVQECYAQAGLSDALHLEHFGPAAPLAATDNDAQGEVRLSRSERLLSNDGDTLLNQAEAAGVKPESGCRMGICYSCTCRKTTGQVRDVRTGKLSNQGEEDIQICVSVPVGTVTLDL